MTLFRDRYSIIHSIFLQDEISIQLPQDKRNLHPDLFMSTGEKLRYGRSLDATFTTQGCLAAISSLVCCGFLIFLSDRDFDNPQD